MKSSREPGGGSRFRHASALGLEHLALLADSVDGSPRVQAQRAMAEQMNQGAPLAQFKRKEDELPAQRKELKDQERPAQTKSKLEEKKTLQGSFEETSSSVQFREADAPAPNRTGLPDQLKAGVESLSGISLDNVKVHFNSSHPAQLNALAHTQGSDIHVAPGQEEHLPHEAWHVVQQAQGRVKPTRQMKEGTPVNDDQGLEREADEMGRAAAAEGVNAMGEADKLEPPGTTSSRQVLPTLQRKLGFEFETDNVIVGGEIKERIFEDADVRVEGDTERELDRDDGAKGNNVEFVITEASEFERTEARINKAVAIADALNQQRKQDGSVITRNAGPANFRKEVEFVVTDPYWTASPQVTVGVLLSQMGSYLEEAYARANEEKKWHKSQLRKYEKKESPAEDGFVILIATYLRELGDWRPNEDSVEGPKNALVAMSRTNFRSMVRSLNLGGDRLRGLEARVRQVATQERQNLKNLVIPEKMPVVYTSETVQQFNDTTIDQWITSIFADEYQIDVGTDENNPEWVDADEMSPPERFRGPKPRYSMGAMSMDNNLVLLEERSSQVQEGNVAKGEWSIFASEMFDAEHQRFLAEGGEERGEGDVVPMPEAEDAGAEGGEEDEEMTPEEEAQERRYQAAAQDLGPGRS